MGVHRNGTIWMENRNLVTASATLLYRYYHSRVRGHYSLSVGVADVYALMETTGSRTIWGGDWSPARPCR